MAIERRILCTAAPSCLSKSATIWLIHAMNFQLGTSRDCEERDRHVREAGVRSDGVNRLAGCLSLQINYGA